MKKLWAEFKAFAFKGNVIDLAVGMMIGSAFTAIVTALVNSVLMPLLSLITGKVDFNDMVWVIGETQIPYGAFLQSIFNFIAIAVCIFAFVKVIAKLNSLKKKEEAKEEVKPEPPRLCPYCFTEIHKEATRCPHCTSVLDK
ncbi:MAG: large conductance mechanosensitive channel protein MscL [Clostridia bacterium]|nr:large conductance mechanosensitive channel protein MscL [Clostridia bacterium]